MLYVLKDELREFIQEVSKLLGNGSEKAILYGSYARGDYDDFYIASKEEAEDQIKFAE